MKTKLTLTIKKDILDRAKIYAFEQDLNYKELIENYLKILAQESEKSSLSPKVKELLGIVKTVKNFDYKIELADSLSKKSNS